jgi:hypothetical protein
MIGLVNAGDLFRYEPTVAPRGDRRRTLWMTAACHEWCRPPAEHPDVRVTDEALVQLQEVLNSFVFYDEMVNGLDMKKLDPPELEVWEFRSYVAEPFLRVFGSFVVPSHFLAINYRLRGDLEARRGPQWDRAIAEAAQRRGALMPNPPCVRNSFAEYLL